MKSRTIAAVLALLISGLAVAQEEIRPQNLPDAPSTTVTPAAPRPQPPAPEQPKSAPLPTAPALETPFPGKTAPPQTSGEEPAQQQAVAAPKKTAPPAADDKSLTTDELGNPLETIKVPVNEVNVVFTVTDKHGHFVRNLTQKDFKVLDDNKPAASVRSFRSETDLPLRVGLLIDASNSVRDRFRFEQEAAIEFLSSIVRPKSDRAFVIGFDTTPEVTQDFTDNNELLSRGVRMLRPGGGTALYDAVYYSCRDKLLKAPTPGPTRRAIILLSDGDDNQSRVTREEAIEMAQRAEVIVYTISTNISGVKLRGDKVLERLADATGGRAFFPFKIQDVANAFSEIQDELRSQYALSYKPADFKSDGHYRSIDILAENHKGLKVRARKGYFAPRQ
ncbi:MAG: VWA domain-containing protein [Terriglobales bacterium]